jgi:acetyl-CoA acetyltransferase
MWQMREVAVVSFGQVPNVRNAGQRNEVEMIMSAVTEAVQRSGIPRKEIGFTCSGSCDYLQGAAFAFVMGLDAVGAWPPISESHVEMDAAWAVYESWVKIQTGQADSALIYGFGKCSMGHFREILTLQLDPYYLMPLWPDSVSLAALQARALLESRRFTEEDMAEVAVRSRRNAQQNPNAQVKGEFDAAELLTEAYLVSPLRKHDCPPISDGASALVLAADDLARRVCKRPAWIRGIDHRIEAHALGVRDLARSPSTERAAREVGVGRGPVDLAELHAPFTHQELILCEALGLDEDAEINPSGGALAANAFMVAGLTRIGEAANRILDGGAHRAVAHATSGPCLQHNLVCVLEGE